MNNLWRKNSPHGRAITDSVPGDPRDGSRSDDVPDIAKPDNGAITKSDEEVGDSSDRESVAATTIEMNARGGVSVRARAVLHNISWTRVAAYGILPILALVLASTAAFMRWQDYTVRVSESAGHQAMRAASDTAVALLSYRPETVDKDLGAAQRRLTGSFRDAYSKLTDSMVIPTAKREKITTVATVQAAGLVSATAVHAVVLLSVNQTMTLGTGAPTNSAWSVRATVDKVDQRWLVSAFDPV